jgi:hypothetical protein
MEFGVPQKMKLSGGWILRREIPGLPDLDAMGLYPVFSCTEWRQLHADLESLQDDIVTLSVVTDPFGQYDIEYLKQCFRDVVIPFKEHFVVDLRRPLEEAVSKHHRYYARKALEKVQIEPLPDPPVFIDEWTNLYATLVSKHNLSGIRAFSKRSFAKQLSVPGVVAFKAVYENTTVGAHLWYTQGDIAYSHLAAFSPLGYNLMASYALYWYAIQYFADKVHGLDIGAGAGSSDRDGDGLSWFKRGWSTETRTAYFCGRILDHARYARILKTQNIPQTDYFPPYRLGEFG